MTLFEKFKEIVFHLLAHPGCRPVSVGGSVRDAVALALEHPVCFNDDIGFEHHFEQSSKDFDLEVYGIDESEVTQILMRNNIQVEKVGRAFPVYKVKGFNIDISFPRSEVRIGDTHTDFEVVTDPDMSFFVAARRRDFTCNAIGYDWRSSKLLDPYFGMNDIEYHILKAVSDEFSEDALRVLRAFKFVGRLGFYLNDHTMEMCRTMVPELKTYARERMLPEWIDFILNVKPENITEAMEFLIESDTAMELYPELFALKGTPQSPQHHPEGDVMVHTMQCLEYFANSIRAKLANDEERLIVGLAVLTHDFGKPTCTELSADKTEVLHSHCHEDSPLVRKFLERLFDPADRRIDEIERLVRAHMRPSALFNNNAGMSAIRRLNLAVDGRIDRLLAVVECDMGGRQPLTVNREVLDWVSDKTKQIGGDTSTKIKPIILGRHLIQHLNMKPSPDFKPVLDRMFQAQLDGLFTDEKTGIEYLFTHGKAG
jgi:tRNA nucleotidyltransferase (CCA-adding enzyme)